MIQDLHQPPTTSPRTPRPAERRAFTVTELLVVISIIVIILALALPAFNLITGGKSVEGATNNIAAFLGRARTEAMALNRETGVFFYIDPANQRRTMAIVRKADATALNFTFFEIADTVDTQSLPDGIDVQTIDTNGTTGADRYIGYNKFNASNVVRSGGMIVFDGNGYLVQRRYAFLCNSGGVPNETGKFLYSAEKADSDPSTILNVYPPPPPPPPVPVLTVLSQVGIVLFRTDAFEGRGFTKSDADLSYGANDDGGQRAYNGGPAATNEQAEEAWIDANALPILINRFNGTLVRYAER